MNVNDRRPKTGKKPSTRTHTHTHTKRNRVEDQHTGISSQRDSFLFKRLNREALKDSSTFKKVIFVTQTNTQL